MNAPERTPETKGAPEPAAWAVYVEDAEYDCIEDGLLFGGEDDRLMAYWTERDARIRHPLPGGKVVPLYTLARAREAVIAELEAEATKIWADLDCMVPAAFAVAYEQAASFLRDMRGAP